MSEELTEHLLAKIRAQKTIEEKQNGPVYKTLDIEPKEGGKSLLHDDHGLPKVAPTKKKDAVPSKEFSDKPVGIKATKERIDGQANSGPSRTHLPKKQIPVIEHDDGFLPPKSNFVSVGNVDQSWHSDKVTGMVDNNEEVDVDSMQGTDPTAGMKPEEVLDSEDPKRDEFEGIYNNTSNNIKAIKASGLMELDNAQSAEDVDSIAQQLFNKKNGLFTIILEKFGELPDQVRRPIGELINDTVTELRDTINTKRVQFEEDDEDYQTHMEEEKENIPEVKITNGHPYGISIDGELQQTAASANDAKKIISTLLLKSEIDLSRIELTKKIPLDFGLVLKE